MTPHYGSTEGFPSQVPQQSENMQSSGLCAPDPSLFQPKINRLQQCWRLLLCQVSIHSFHFITPTTYPYNIITISVSPYCVVSTNN